MLMIPTLLMWLPNVQRELVMGSLCMKVVQNGQNVYSFKIVTGVACARGSWWWS
jgi:hypothetical protein